MEKFVGDIYIFVNPSFPEYVKIGYADDYKKRLKELNRSECVPFAFRPYAIYHVTQRLQDRKVHEMIDRINPDLRAIDSFNGKKRLKEFYAISPEDAYSIMESIASISGSLDRLVRLTPSGEEIKDQKLANEIEEANSYLEQNHIDKIAFPALQDFYFRLRDSIVRLGNVSVEPKKMYIAFKTTTNFVDIQICGSFLVLIFNLRKGMLDPDKDGVQDISGIGHCGNGDYRIMVNETASLNKLMELVEKSYEFNKCVNA